MGVMSWNSAVADEQPKLVWFVEPVTGGSTSPQPLVSGSCVAVPCTRSHCTQLVEPPSRCRTNAPVTVVPVPCTRMKYCWPALEHHSARERWPLIAHRLCALSLPQTQTRPPHVPVKTLR